MSKKNIAEQETKIKDSLFDFVKTHIPEADLNLIDEIVLSYVISVLEDVGSDPVFDVEGEFKLYTYKNKVNNRNKLPQGDSSFFFMLLSICY